MKDTENEKESIRSSMITLRRNMKSENKDTADKRITSLTVQQIHILQANTICLYLSKPEETGTEQLITDLLGMRKTVVVPRVLHQELSLYRILTLDDVAQGAFGVREPKTSNRSISAFEIDVFVVPGIAFDRQGNRLGWGKGYYDRLLKNVEAPRLGLAYSCQILPHIPHEPYDIVMSEIVTEKEIITVTSEKR